MGKIFNFYMCSGVMLVIFLFCTTVLGEDGSCYLHEHLNYDVKGEVPLLLEENSNVETSARVLGHVSVATQGDSSELKILDLQITGPDGKMYEKPEGWDRPVHYRPDDKPLLRGLRAEEGDTLRSISVKQAIINLLPQQAGNISTHSQIQDILDLLDEGKEKILLSDNHKDIVLILGNTGAGKSTLTQWLAGTDNILVAKEIQEGDYIIEDDKNKISKDTIQSQTTFPELVMNAENTTAYYDLPGFSDTRSSSNDIATSYFTTRVIEHASIVKLVFLINYSSVRKGVDRKDFVELLRHATELIKDVTKFKNSTALVVTKVDNLYKKGKLIDDHIVVRGIADFLSEVKRVLEHRKTVEASSLSAKVLMFYENAIKLLEVFLMTDSGDYYARISIFRRPDDVGILTDMNPLEEEKRVIRKMVNEILTYSRKDDDDFGRTISESSKNEINYLVEEVEKNILFGICDIVHKIKDYFDVSVNQLINKLTLINVNDTIIADYELSEANKLLSKLDSEFNVIATLVDNIKNVQSLENTPEIIYNEISTIGFNISNKSMSNMLNEGHYLKFLLESSDKEFNTRISALASVSEFQNLLTDIVVKKNRIQNYIILLSNKLDEKIIYDIENVGEELKKQFSEREENIVDLKCVCDELKSKYEKLIGNTDNMEPNEYTEQIIAVVSHANVSFASHIPIFVMKYDKYLKVLKENINEVVKYLYDSQTWYKFLIRLYENLSRYDIQKNTSKCYELSTKITQFDDNKLVETTAIEEFLEQCYQNEYKEQYDDIKYIKLDKAKIWHLQKLLNLLLNDVSYSCYDNGKLTVQGAHVLMSDVINKACVDPIKFIEIFALNTVFIDTYLKKGGVQLVIVAPTWDIRSDQRIILDGLPGMPHNPLQAVNGYYPIVDGRNGKPGNPGGTSGSFFGIGDVFINIEGLDISANGGDGGPGQNGGTGGKGQDGSTPYLRDPAKDLKYNNAYRCYFFYCDYDTITSDTCTNGGDGGNGGSGGIGGYPGIVNVVSTSTDITINKSVQPGDTGRNGNGGRNGRPGAGGRKADVTWAWPRFWDMTKVTYSDLPNCSWGSVSRDINYNDRAQPERPQNVNITLVIDDYKAFVADTGGIIESFTTEFVKKISLYNFEFSYTNEMIGYF